MNIVVNNDAIFHIAVTGSIRGRIHFLIEVFYKNKLILLKKLLPVMRSVKVK